MKIISCYKLLLILITWTMNFSEQIKHINGLSSIDVCKGQDVDLTWKVNEEKDKISKLDWYLNNKTICTSSPVEDFKVKLPYHGRIERIGRTEIRLKNVSRENEGIYILFPLFEWLTTENMPEIELRVLEPPTKECTYNIIHLSDLTSELTESYCGRPHVSLVWKRKQTFEVLGKENLILSSTLQDKELLCCLDGEAMKCVNDSRQFCTIVTIPHRDTERTSEDGNTQSTDSVNMPGTDTGSTSSHIFLWLPLTLCLLTTIFVLVLYIIICKMRKNKKYRGEEIMPMLEMKHHAVEPLIMDDPKLEKSSTLYEHQYSPSLITMKEIQELRQGALCKICFVKEISVVFMPCSHIVTCAYCSIPFNQCPLCRALIKRKMNICSD